MKEELQQKIDLKTKPQGALGKLEKLAQQIGTVQNTLSPELTKPTIVVFAGDHGIANAGVSAYPQEVTYQMVLNFLNEGAAINVFCKQHQIDLLVVDTGVKFKFEPHKKLIQAKVEKGTKNFLEEKAMNIQELESCLSQAEKIVNDLHTAGCNIIGFGEMGIGNTSAATMMMSNLCGLPIESCVGRGTALNDEQFAHKISILKQCELRHGRSADPVAVLQTYGGFEIAHITGAMLAAYENNMLIMVDGFIATAAYLAAVMINPLLQNNAIFCHLSDETGHLQLLKYLQADPILSLNMRLGEGTGCAVAYPLIQSAVLFLNEMASFESSGVSSKEA
ncbi:nicotinate-nucleotide--dimethylbenzimidazole phosphoribosyltransferase [Pedobacter sp. PACM 27299]|uniref:nicotinate-nucleotide--dimethylbenzimidazole phosphoribosyltransferase n=1 Tax=Pedobacter sp. PACM 27299 TaxID=1727164 RepID=UPI000705D24F|nr:nicotinate-nucleotide--dimethylbenzimidazole phosphoribosyltransferase [Pedobacter sp. PACM 27299]ALL05424.1 nicotinate-nucleotide--dimethylbenzimidazole phosphoribosyltransferase [Pedobacter sp. PACM 27299]